MNKLLGLFLFLISTVFFKSSIAAEDQTFKCYVEMAGGGEHIHSILYPEGGMKISEVEKSMRGHKVYYNGKKVPIYKINECIIEDKQFKSNIAKEMDKNRDPF